jgi:hypothetical protein
LKIHEIWGGRDVTRDRLHARFGYIAFASNEHRALAKSRLTTSLWTFKDELAVEPVEVDLGLLEDECIKCGVARCDVGIGLTFHATDHKSCPFNAPRPAPLVCIVNIDSDQASRIAISDHMQSFGVFPNQTTPPPHGPKGGLPTPLGEPHEGHSC